LCDPPFFSFPLPLFIFCRPLVLHVFSLRASTGYPPLPFFFHPAPIPCPPRFPMCDRPYRESSRMLFFLCGFCSPPPTQFGPFPNLFPLTHAFFQHQVDLRFFRKAFFPSACPFSFFFSSVHCFFFSIPSGFVLDPFGTPPRPTIFPPLLSINPFLGRPAPPRTPQRVLKVLVFSKVSFYSRGQAAYFSGTMESTGDDSWSLFL